ncbi:MAG: hypothetical protein HY901_34410 [Deltaproteobacteria bacterium]|nr:hypothetical protein [Deltaproteobacteria bacterium]
MREEGKTTRAIESRTSRAPSFFYMGLAIGSMAVSAGLFLTGRKNWSQFIGLWAPTILITGLYNKIVKVQESLQPASMVPTA